MMELVITLARTTKTSIATFLNLPIKRLNAWVRATINVLKKENANNV